MRITEGAINRPVTTVMVFICFVVFGAFNRPRMFGYAFHENIEEPDPECLGRRQTHPACIAAMERITVDRVLEAMGRLWG